MKSPAPFVMSWNIQYLGSYTVRKIASDSLQRRMDKVSNSDIIPQFVYLSISLNGVYVATEDKPKIHFLLIQFEEFVVLLEILRIDKLHM
jgi:hypothetical protein